MGIRCRTNTAALKALNDRVLSEVSGQVMIQLDHLGQDCVRRIRKKEGTLGWNDQSGNLRSSIGAAAYSWGRKKMQTVFGQVLEGREGVKAGQRMIDSLAGKYDADPYALVVVAGMDYASYVEDMDGKDVLASTRLWAEQQTDERINDAVENAAARISRMKP